MKRNLTFYLAIAGGVILFSALVLFTPKEGYFGRAMTDSFVLVDAAVSTTTGNAFLVKDYETVVCAVDTANSANLTIKFTGSISDTSPDPTVAQAATNQWDYIHIVDLENGAVLDGDTGIVLAGTDDNRMFEINTNLLQWLIPMVTSYSAGTSTVSCVGASD